MVRKSGCKVEATKDGWEATYTSDVGIEELNKAQFIISPNPATDFLKLECNMPVGKTIFKVYGKNT